MKTQISKLRSGAKTQILNSNVNYYELPSATSHIGHAGTNNAEVQKVWKQVIAENPEKMNIVVNGIALELKADWSLSGKSVIYSSLISKEDLNKFGIAPAKKKMPFISIQLGNIITVSNGKNSYVNICPSFIEIL